MILSCGQFVFGMHETNVEPELPNPWDPKALRWRPPPDSHKGNPKVSRHENHFCCLRFISQWACVWNINVPTLIAVRLEFQTGRQYPMPGTSSIIFPCCGSGLRTALAHLWESWLQTHLWNFGTICAFARADLMHLLPSAALLLLGKSINFRSCTGHAVVMVGWLEDLRIRHVLNVEQTKVPDKCMSLEWIKWFENVRKVIQTKSRHQKRIGTDFDLLPRCLWSWICVFELFPKNSTSEI